MLGFHPIADKATSDLLVQVPMYDVVYAAKVALSGRDMQKTAMDVVLSGHVALHGRIVNILAETSFHGAAIAIVGGEIGSYMTDMLRSRRILHVWPEGRTFIVGEDKVKFKRVGNV